MKANEAPEKIYLATTKEVQSLNHSFVGIAYSDPQDIVEPIEYTRTDAFVEKVCVKLKKLMYDNLMFQGRLHREEVIDNFIEDFKKYMKGEKL